MIQARQLVATVALVAGVGFTLLLTQAKGQQATQQDAPSKGLVVIDMKRPNRNVVTGWETHVVYDSENKTVSLVRIYLQENDVTDIDVMKVLNYQRVSLKSDKTDKK